MSMPSDWFEASRPSEHVVLLQQLRGQKLTKLTRYSERPPEAWTRPGPEWSNYDPLPPHQVFSFADGPLLLGVATGLEIAFGLNDHLEITLDAQRLPDGSKSEYQFGNDPEYFPVDAAQSRFCRPEIHQMLGRRILDVTLLRMDGRRYGKNRSFEAGLIFHLEHGPELVLSGNLTDGLDEFAVTLRAEILPKYHQYLTEERLWEPLQ